MNPDPPVMVKVPIEMTDAEAEALKAYLRTKIFVTAMHASAPEGHLCSDCTMDDEPCPTCYTAWWKTRHPNTRQLP